MLAVVAYPELDDSDRLWIELLRARHDPQAARLGAHITLVFPFAASVDAVLPHISEVAHKHSAIPFTTQRAMARADDVDGGGHVFLTMIEGRALMEALHDRLYDGVLAAHLRPEVPYIPHLTIGAFPEMFACERLASEVNASRRTVAGTLRRIELIGLQEAGVRTVAAFALGAHAADRP